MVLFNVIDWLSVFAPLLSKSMQSYEFRRISCFLYVTFCFIFVAHRIKSHKKQHIPTKKMPKSSQIRASYY